MALKELREIRGIVIAALVVYGLIVVAAIHPHTPLDVFAYLSMDMQVGDRIPFVNDASVGKFYFFAAVMATALGLWQTFSESVRGTYPFLLHRPAGGRWVIGVKLAVGTVVYLTCTAVPLAIYSLWAATPGAHASPFEWSMTVSSWVVWLAMTMLYYGAFLAGIRPGRWYRSRFLPLAAAVFALIVVVGLAFTVFDGTLWPCGIVLAVDVWMIAMILFVARSRDYS
jgi:hypothetical protein